MYMTSESHIRNTATALTALARPPTSCTIPLHKISKLGRSMKNNIECLLYKTETAKPVSTRDYVKSVESLYSTCEWTTHVERQVGQFCFVSPSTFLDLALGTY